MPYFSIVMEGKGILIKSDDAAESIIGFFTTRMVRAASSEEAENKVKEMITAEWMSGHYAKANKGVLPEVSIESVSQKPMIEYLKFKNGGYSFYCREN
jgi:hypothetical protein